MTHLIIDAENQKELSIENGYYEKLTTINILDKTKDITLTYYLDKKQLHDFIGTLLHVQSKMRK